MKMGKTTFVSMVKKETQRIFAMLKKGETGEVEPEVALSYTQSNCTFLRDFISSQVAKGLEEEAPLPKVSRKGKKVGTSPTAPVGSSQHKK